MGRGSRSSCGSLMKSRRDFDGRWRHGQIRRRQVRTFRSEVWRWWRHSVFSRLALLVSGIRAIDCSFTSPRDRTVICRVTVFCVDTYRCVVSWGCYVIMRFLCVPFMCIVSYRVVLVLCASFCVLCWCFLLFVREIRRTTWKSMFLTASVRSTKKTVAS